MLTYSVWNSDVVTLCPAADWLLCPLKLWRRITNVSWSLAGEFDNIWFNLIWFGATMSKSGSSCFFAAVSSTRNGSSAPCRAALPCAVAQVGPGAVTVTPGRPYLGNDAEIWWWLYSNPQYSVYSSLGLSKEYIREIDWHILYFHIIKSRYLWILWLF